MESISKHDRIQMQIVSTCRELGFEVKQEHRGKGWRADVFVRNNDRPIAFEIQLSPQTLRKTIERQTKYDNDGILGCWFFETPVFKLNQERPDLPLFYVEENNGSPLMVNLGERKKVDLSTFLANLICDNIQFRTVAKTKMVQSVKVAFYEMACWKCGELNHLFYVATPFYSSCNAKIKPEESLWGSDSVVYMPEIISLVKSFAKANSDLGLNLASIKDRYSNTVELTYTSFGCYKCDSIFGDFYVMDAKIDAMYDPELITCQGEVELQDIVTLDVPHWCFPKNGEQFCNNN
ncbi:hypothetical protein LJ707_16215 [Mucilaginibacter sp. UR6-1]|uniref:competence protein CoiA family protein n=1 Tax=Mucilaginibacter sp. UR6-1 TaxID=1435643 RepID=UPI001E50AD8A|nr:hypothetical protein [Mucilaginibacter sp. UR6-1]MCC8410488.1 hypothetical protein [Mucilaginibacter sp. UR6-1]